MSPTLNRSLVGLALVALVAVGCSSASSTSKDPAAKVDHTLTSPAAPLSTSSPSVMQHVKPKPKPKHKAKLMPTPTAQPSPPPSSSSAPPPPPPPTSKSPNNCIPQGGGDHDSDNSGGPSDGDGCL